LAEKLKEITGRKVLNFGTANNFGLFSIILFTKNLQSSIRIQAW